LIIDGISKKMGKREKIKKTIKKQDQWIPVVVTSVIIGGLVIAYFTIDNFEDFVKEAWNVLTSEDESRIEDWISQFGAWGPVILMASFLVQMFAFVIPSWMLILVSILAYGPFIGSLYALAGIFLAATVAYYIGSLLGEYTLEKIVGKKSEKKMKAYLKRYGFWLVVIFRMAPFLSNDTISFVAGLVDMRYRRFILATLLGILPLIALTAFLGETNERLKSGFIWVSVISIVGYGAYIWWDHKHGKKIIENKE
jgi:uncharacterized membrane protein YdjX (TVP38/TMEM64 family)